MVYLSKVTHLLLLALSLLLQLWRQSPIEHLVVIVLAAKGGKFIYESIVERRRRFQSLHFGQFFFREGMLKGNVTL